MMTLKEAEDFISNSERTFLYNNELFTMIIVPDNNQDLINFLVDIRNRQTTTLNVEKYSSDNKYKVQAIMNKAYNI